jgi:hypothetical protein
MFLVKSEWVKKFNIRSSFIYYLFLFSFAVMSHLLVYILLLTLTTGVIADLMVRSTYAPPPPASHSTWASPKILYYIFGFVGLVASIVGMIKIAVSFFRWLRKEGRSSCGGCRSCGRCLKMGGEKRSKHRVNGGGDEFYRKK